MSANSLRAYSDLLTHLTSRPLRFTTPRVLNVAHVEGSASTIGVVPPRGSVVIYCAPNPGAIIDSIEQALSSNDRRALETLASQIDDLLKDKVEPSAEEVLRTLHEVETVFEVRYRGKTIVEANGLLRGYAFSTTTVAYTGGALRAEDFAVAEHVVDEKAAGYRYLIAIRPPVLTELERAVLEKLPVELAEMTIGGSVSTDKEDTVKKVADAAAEMVRREKTTWHKPGILDFLDDQLETHSISPNASAALLMKAREELIIRSQKQQQ
jgi:hypothetical protein